MLQIAIESCIDIGNHLISTNSWKKPESYQEVFKILTKHAIITESHAKQFEKMTGIRNMIIHQYFKVEKELIYSVIQDNLEDLREFPKTIIARLDLDIE